MNRHLNIITMASIGVSVIFLFGSRLLPVHGRAKTGSNFAAVPGEIGGQDLSGPYEVVENWPKPISDLPGHEKWTWGPVGGVAVENPNRVFILQHGEIPMLKRPENTPVPQFGPSLSFPVNALPFRNAGQSPLANPQGPEGGGPWIGKMGIDARWEHCLVVVDAHGNITETWTQWDKMFKTPHAIFINPYDPEKNVWVLDSRAAALYEFSNDGKRILQTIGVPNEPGTDEKHLVAPTHIAWLPDGTMFVADGYEDGRIVKYNKDGKFLMAWGQKSSSPKDTRGGYFSEVHGVVVDPTTRKVYVNDRLGNRLQVFDEDGKFIDQWSYGPVSSVYFLYLSADRHLWLADAATSRIIEYDLTGHLLYSWGILGDWPGSLWGVHGMSVDQDGNLYVAEVEAGRAQKFRPRKGANPNYLVGQPFRMTGK